MMLRPVKTNPSAVSCVSRERSTVMVQPLELSLPVPIARESSHPVTAPVAGSSH
jgi:hypothetical protein